MPHPKQHITDLAELCYQQGVEYIVISPGSRNAPLIIAFVKRFGEKCISIVDERSAGYFALGLARTGKKPVVLISTSGTAVLNYSPSIAEAYYQQVPLLAITADRPAEWIDQLDNQTIRQNEVYKNFIKNSYQLPLDVDSDISLADAQNTIVTAIQNTVFNLPGPVHLNVPLDEPLYDPLPDPSINLPALKKKTSDALDFTLPEEIITQWSEAERILLIHGHYSPDDKISERLQRISADPRVVVIAENISNCSAMEIISNPDILLAKYSNFLKLPPDLLIYSAGQVVSKKLRIYLRSFTIKNTWRIGLEEYPIDTFSQNNRILKVAPEQFLPLLERICKPGTHSEYKNIWLRASSSGFESCCRIVGNLPFSDLKAFEILLTNPPSDCIIELGNSSSIRYSQVFESRPDITYYSNRGISGIDGCLSTAVGTAFASVKFTLCILGDLSFVYDSNALWNQRLPKNLRIIVINNSGGDIFNLIEGPNRHPEIQPFLNSHHPVSIQKLAEAFNLTYFCSENGQELKDQLITFYKAGSKAALLEIKTQPDQNSVYFRQIMSKGRLPENTK